MRRRRALGALLLGGVGALLLLGAGEVTLRARYGHVRLPPDWNLLTRPDPDLGRRFVPGSRLNFSLLPGANADLPVRINRLGYRGPDPTRRKSDDVFRIACLGDSTTFGWFVREEEAYPSLLERRLRVRAGGRTVEVFNFGAPGHTTWRGRFVLDLDALPLRPDLVVLAYGFNDGEPGGDEEAGRAPDLVPRESLLAWRLRRLAGRLYVGRWLTARFGLDAPRRAASPLPPERRVPPEKIEANLRWMLARASRDGAAAVLVHQNIPSPYGREVFRAAAREADVPLVEARRVLEGASAPPPDGEALGLAPAGTRPHDRPALLVRLDARGAACDVAVARAPGASLLCDRLPLRDDGTGGDERPGDGIASALVEGPFPEPSPWIAFVPTGRMDDLPGIVPAARAHFHETKAPLGTSLRTTPILARAPRYASPGRDGEPRMPPDDVIHPNAAGHRLLAEAIAEAIEGTGLFRRFADGR